MEDKLRSSLDQLNEEETSYLLEKDMDFDIDKKALARIKSSVYKKIETNKKLSFFSKKFIACAAAVMLIFCTMFYFGFDNVAAAVRQVIAYIPGFGLAPEDTAGDMPEVKVMKDAAFLQINGEKVEFYSGWLNIYKDQVIVTVILRYPQNIDLNGEITLLYNGEKIFRDSELPDFPSINDKKKNKEMTYTYTIKNPKTPINTLTFGTEDSKVDIAFDKSEDLKDKVISQNFNGIIVSAIPLNPDRSKFILTSTYEKEMKGVKFISSLATALDSQIKAMDEAGNEYEIKKSTSQGSEYYVEGEIKGKIVSLKFNKLYQGFFFESDKTFKGVNFKVPQIGEKININKSLGNAISSINLKTVERSAVTNENPHNLMFTYEIKSKIPGIDIYNLALYVEKTGGVVGGSMSELHKEGDSYIVKYGVIADENAAENTVNIIPYNSFYSNLLLLDKECILKFQ